MSSTSAPLPAGAKLGPEKQIDAGALKVFESVKDDVLRKIWELHKADVTHHLNEVKKIDHVKFYKPVRYRLEDAPVGVNYFGAIVLDEHGHTIHVRVFRPSEGEGPTKFHSIHTRASEDGGAVFGEKDEILYFEY